MAQDYLPTLEIASMMSGVVDSSARSFRILDPEKLRSLAAKELFEYFTQPLEPGDLSRAIRYLRRLCYTICAVPAKIPESLGSAPQFQISAQNREVVFNLIKTCHRHHLALPVFYSSDSSEVFCANAYTLAIWAQVRGPLFLSGEVSESLGIYNLKSARFYSECEPSKFKNWSRSLVFGETSPGLKE